MNNISDSPVATVRAQLARRRMPRWAVWGLIALGVVLLLLAAMRLFFGGSDQPAYATAEIERRDLLVSVSATGNLQPTRQVDVGSETSGIVTLVYVDNNDRVVKGQPLARIDTDRLEDALLQAQANLVSARAQVASSEASVAQSRAQLDRLERVREISKGEVPSDAELDQGRAAYRQAAAQLQANKAAVRQAEAQVSSSRTSLARATIYAPVTGIVLSRKIDPGQTVAATFQTPELFVIAEDLSQMRLDVKVDEADIGRVAEGQQARFTVDAFPGRTFPAKVVRVDVGANNDTGSATTSAASSVVSYVARLSVANPDGQLRPGMTAVATIAADRYRDVWVVPLPALRFEPPKEAQSEGLSFRPPRPPGSGNEQQSRLGVGSRQTLYVLGEDGKLTGVPVRTVAISGSEAAVEGEKLKKGMRIVTGLLESEEE